MPKLRHYVRAGLVLIGIGIAGAVVFSTSGIYNVSAARQHFDFTTWVLDVSRRSSVRTYSMGIEPPPLDDPAMIRLGATYYDYGCAPCHGAPDHGPSPIAGSMLPDAPPLEHVAADWSAAELFWIVHNGQKYTGMPAWLDYEREDEVWPVVAFLQNLANLDENAYRELAAGAASQDQMPETAGRFMELPEDDALIACIRCHGEADGNPVSAQVPRLGGQPTAYLMRALREFAADRRPSGMMDLFATRLDDAQITDFANYYAAGSPGPQVGDLDGDPEAGSEIFSTGLPEQDVPACVTCHVVSQNPDYPRLDGQSASYVRQQLRNWHEGLRDESSYGLIMAPIARRLTERQMADVAAYVATLPPLGGDR